jgi:hypothetical protein
MKNAYRMRINLAREKGLLGTGRVDILVAHDPDCPAIVRRRDCTCHPDIFAQLPNGLVEILDDGSTRPARDHYAH